MVASGLPTPRAAAIVRLDLFPLPSISAVARMALYSESAASGPSKLTPEQQRIMNASDIEEYESDALLPPLDENSPLLSSGASTTSTTAGSSDSGKDESLLRRMRRASPMWYVVPETSVLELYRRPLQGLTMPQDGCPHGLRVYCSKLQLCIR